MRTIGVRFPEVHATLLEQSATARSVTVSEILREAFVFWREHAGDRQGALEQWTSTLLERHGAEAVLTVTYDAEVLGDHASVQIDGAPVEEFVADAVHDRGERAQLWVGDPQSDARAFLGRVPTMHGAAITVPIAALPRLGASDVDAV
jgi:hypothetical protein